MNKLTYNYYNLKAMYIEKGPYKFLGNPTTNKEKLVLESEKQLENGDLYYGFW